MSRSIYCFLQCLVIPAKAGIHSIRLIGFRIKCGMTEQICLPHIQQEEPNATSILIDESYR
ncbi:MAG: hypothetical protein HYZ34_10625 [Ignavibacteriae bacterium]|nr:hypothetical protein [Ignavibacteriota bacterium]